MKQKMNRFRLLFLLTLISIVAGESLSQAKTKRCLMFQNQPVPLTPKAFQTLVVLLRHHGRVVEKEYFLSEVWADTFVEESTVAQNILTLRKTLKLLK